MFLLHREGHFTVAILMSAWLFIVSSCNEPPRIDRVSITPIVPSGQRAERIDVTSTSTPALLQPGQQAELSVDVTHKGSDLKVQWYAPGNKGHFLRSTDSLTTSFVAPNEMGPVEVVCQISANGETRTINLPIVVADQPVSMASVTPVPANPSPEPSPQNSGPFDIDKAGFIPCGWMGDGEGPEKYLQVEEVQDRTPTGTTATKWSFRPGGKNGWLAVGWQYTPEKKCNWGDYKGVDLRGRGLRRVSVWVKGVPDSEQKLPVMQFKAGGNADPTKRYKASFSIAGEFITVSNQWQQYHLDIPPGEDLSSVISALTLVLRSRHNPNGATFYLGDITYDSGR